MNERPEVSDPVTEMREKIMQICPGRADQLMELITPKLETLVTYDALFRLQWERSMEADALWRAEDPETRANIMPDLGEVLTWLIERGNRAQSG